MGLQPVLEPHARVQLESSSFVNAVFGVVDLDVYKRQGSYYPSLSFSFVSTVDAEPGDYLAIVAKEKGSSEYIEMCIRDRLECEGRQEHHRCQPDLLEINFSHI